MHFRRHYASQLYPQQWSRLCLLLPGHQLSVGTNKHIVADNGLKFIRTIVVAGNGSRADVNVIANFRIAQVSQMTSFRAFTQTRFFISTKLPT